MIDDRNDTFAAWAGTVEMPPDSSRSHLRAFGYGLPVLLSRYSAVACPALCCATLLICIALAHPFANSAFNDDWSYSHVALKLAETGRMHYNGWGSPMILFQSVWAAIWIRLFGFSFDLLRTITIPFSLGFILLVYALGRKVGLNREFAAFGALTVGTSPLFVPLAASFMTEAYSCFLIIVCVYAAIASAEATDTIAALRWLLVLVIAGLAGGSNRQVVWAAPLALIPYLIWKKRPDPRFVRYAAIAYGVCIASIALLMAKFSQPYAPLELSGNQIFEVALQRGWTLPLLVVIAVFTCALISLPVLFCLTPFWTKIGAFRLIFAALLGIAGTGCLFLVFGVRIGLAPFVGNILSPFGILHAGEDALGFRPPALPLYVRVTITCVVLFNLVAGGYVWKARLAMSNRAPVAVFAIFSGAYIVLFIPGALLGVIYDRYALPLLPILVTFILMAFQSQPRRVPTSGWICLVIFASYGVATTHDYFSALRARVLAAQTLEQRAIPRRVISAGIEYDAWTQLQDAGTIKPVLYGDRTELTVWNEFWFWEKTTALRPEYVVAYWQLPYLPRRQVLTVPFRTWLPPLRRVAVVLRRADLPRLTSH